MQKLVFVQVVDAHRATVFLEVVRAADHAPGRVRDLAGAQAAVFHLAHADGHVEALRDQLDVAVVQNHVHVHVREVLKELAQNRRQVVHAEVGVHRDAQKARGRALHRGHQCVGLARVVQNAAGAIVVGQTDFGRRDAARGAIKKAGTEARLQRDTCLETADLEIPIFFAASVKPPWSTTVAKASISVSRSIIDLSTVIAPTRNCIAAKSGKTVMRSGQRLVFSGIGFGVETRPRFPFAHRG